ncbi:MAG: hypothetical protein COZ70_08400 [Deltaproteobacteria bacterium CG_4_8_14_3_um_filter_51_11]|nr:DUF2088 domain-containing protein [bacterium]PIP47161.1 MAG: hypothetical protein COX16_05790 [Deltaproteobacteria bacterium CG23_combo_of_CG06-09_8_20_14_all_51_20]PIW00829.1 MAG: hypothetical protein COW41_04325 [Deltaproteobacteria bacterium CG17_big_fil_post_rev_8_21_14_2_50_51_6]PIX19529.1 MAG: hypothetical protein COZ70_08400 [Deltaproteobacteria bacterium CG_4_8_14_3_um_filter_51_11]PIY27208.1 MAG: hypothetical protein COZ11_00570 [Deltaproteobacteria bacterium CG_4_10_14_3_um_filter_
MKSLQELSDPEGAVYAVLADPIENSLLTEMDNGRKNASALISDFTRPAPNKQRSR